jgi:alpha-beta hydrolase superfamily lysophospholipase
MPRREKPWMEGATEEFMEIEGYRIATYTWGPKDAPAVLLVHGWEGRGSQMGAFVAPLREAGYRVVAFDAPAHGKSDGKQTNGFEVGRVVHGLSQRIGEVHGTISHSFGAICVLIAMEAGMEVQRTAMLAPGVEGDVFFRGFSEIIGLPEKPAAILRERVIDNFGREHWDKFNNPYQGQLLSGHSQAAMLVHDTGDREVPYHLSVELAHHTDRSQLLTTRGLGHRRILRDPSVVGEVADFMAGHEGTEGESTPH